MNKQEAIDQLKELLQPSDTVYTILRHVSRSGMTRDISPIILKPDDRGLRPFHADYQVATVLEERLSSGYFQGVRVGGCGMDMGFDLVYRLSQALWPEGFQCIGEGCPSNDHVNGDRNYEPHLHRDGGYALRQEWL